MTRSTPTAEWLERQIRAWDSTASGVRSKLRPWEILDLAGHLHANWLQVESLEVEMLVRAAKRARVFSLPVKYSPKLRAYRDELNAALKPFEKP